jgi:hypothetical protein
MIREAQCYSCHMNTYFQLFGQTEQFNAGELIGKFISGLEDKGTKIDCVTCARKIEYIKNEDGVWDEEIIS